MSHIFISYTHNDSAYLDKLVTWLRANDVAEHEIWYDQHIAGGNNWRDEITAALNEAFVALVIVSANSVGSVYCTFEWAYAMGQGVQIIPLVFDTVSMADVPLPLAAKQFVNCTENIPDYLKEQIRGFRSVPPHVAALNHQIFETIYDTHRRYFILGWLGWGLNGLDNERREATLAYFVRKSNDAHQALQTLMIDKASAFNSRQYRLCWKLIDILKKISRIKPNDDQYLPERLFTQFDAEWLPAFEYFERSGWWRKWMRPYFDRDLNDERNKMEVFAEMMRAFPIFNTMEADMLISNGSMRPRPK